jgi:hypothetical protein
MANVIQHELERQERELNRTSNASTWRQFLGLQQTTAEDKHRQQCVKELQKVLLYRQQFDRTTTNHSTVGRRRRCHDTNS